MAVRVDFNTGTSDAPVWADITPYVRSVSITRGKDELLDGFSAGAASIVLDNRDRRFDPVYASSPYAGSIVPRKEIRVWPDIPTPTTVVRTNTVLNPSVETNVNFWEVDGVAAVAGNRVGATRPGYTPQPLVTPRYGSWQFYVESSGSPGGPQQCTVDCELNVDTTYSFSAWVNPTFGDSAVQWTTATMTLQMEYAGGTYTIDEVTFTSSNGQMEQSFGWNLLSGTQYVGVPIFPAGVGGVEPAVVRISVQTDTLASWFVDGVIVEAAPRAGLYFDGSFTDTSTDDYAWLGTAHNSKSTDTASVFGEPAFVGVIDDWDLNYELGGDNTATVRASDRFSVLANQVVPDQPMLIELTGKRIRRLARTPEVAYPMNGFDVQDGVKYLGTDATVGDGALSYFQQIELSELGQLFVARDGALTFLDASRNNPQIADSVATFADDGTGVPFTELAVVYGSEQLTNVLTVDWPGGSEVASDATSIAAYGVASLGVITLNQNATDARYLADYYTTRFGQPQYRVDSITVNVPSLGDTDRAAVLALELGDVVTVKFTPGGVTPQITQYAKIVRINSTITDAATRYDVEFGLETFNTFPMVLNDAEYGKLNDDYVLGF